MVDINVKELNLTQQSALQYRNYKGIKKNTRVFVNFYNFTCNIADHGNMAGLTGSSNKVDRCSLGHKTEAATAVYARLTIDPVRESMEKAVQAMEKAKDAPDKVVPIRKK